MPMATTDFRSTPLTFATFLIACCTCSHHMSGLCSAQPGCKDFIALSTPGYWAEAMLCCVDASTMDTLIEEVPTSIPNNNIVVYFICLTGDIII